MRSWKARGGSEGARAVMARSCFLRQCHASADHTGMFPAGALGSLPETISQLADIELKKPLAVRGNPVITLVGRFFLRLLPET